MAALRNYDDTQMWFFDPVELLLRLSTYTASLNHAANGGVGLSGGGTNHGRDCPLDAPHLYFISDSPYKYDAGCLNDSAAHD